MLCTNSKLLSIIIFIDLKYVYHIFIGHVNNNLEIVSPNIGLGFNCMKHKTEIQNL